MDLEKKVVTLLKAMVTIAILSIYRIGSDGEATPLKMRKFPYLTDLMLGMVW